MQIRRAEMINRKKILLIDDNRTILKAMDKLLTSEGYVVFATDNWRAAIRIASDEQPDLIISDVDMPEMDGGELAAKFKESPKTKHIKVIFFTSMVTQNDLETTNSGKNVYISKMTERPILLAEIRKHL